MELTADEKVKAYLEGLPGVFLQVETGKCAEK